MINTNHMPDKYNMEIYTLCTCSLSRKKQIKGSQSVFTGKKKRFTLGLHLEGHLRFVTPPGQLHITHVYCYPRSLTFIPVKLYNYTVDCRGIINT